MDLHVNVHVGIKDDVNVISTDANSVKIDITLAYAVVKRTHRSRHNLILLDIIKINKINNILLCSMYPLKAQNSVTDTTFHLSTSQKHGIII